MPTQDEIMAALRNCYDPCCKDREISVVDMGLIEEVHINRGHVQIDMLLTSGWCPFVANLNNMMIEEIEKVDGVESVEIEVVWDPVWTMDRLSESARAKLTIPLEPLIPYREERLKREQQVLIESGGKL